MPLSQLAAKPRSIAAAGGRADRAGALVEVMSLYWMDYRFLPYERQLGIRELEGLGVQVLAHDEEGVAGLGNPDRVAERATYLDRVVSPAGSRATEQSCTEGRHLALAGNGRPRQATRYGLHGIHEYKGKFNPQITRALCNVVDPGAELLLDPFCGSGTALVEGMRLGLDVVGIDRSPLAAFLSTVKAEATATASKGRLAEAVRELADGAAEALERGQRTGRPAALGPSLDTESIAYLESWFTEPAFAGISRALAFLNGRPPSTARRLTQAALSSVLRGVSLQLPEDLRIRRRAEPFAAPPIAPLFLKAVESIERGLAEMCEWPAVESRWRVRQADSADHGQYQPLSGRRQRSLILTSPPYASALPYIDTDRLSLVALGMAGVPELRSLDRELVGSREWTRTEQRRWDARRTANADRLPRSIVRLLAKIERAQAGEDVGFRRAAVPALLYRYFASMGRTIDTWSRVLRPGESAVLIVGRNQTTAGGEAVEIPTSELLADVAATRQFEVREIVKLEAWPRYGLHSANGVLREDAVILTRRPAVSKGSP
jgi:Putative RNA methylase family UPF0020